MTLKRGLQYIKAFDGLNRQKSIKSISKCYSQVTYGQCQVKSYRKNKSKMKKKLKN